MLDFVYTGHVQIEQINVQELLAAADMLQIPEVVSECCDFLCRELHPSNALGILRFAEAHHCEELAQNAQNYVFTNFPQVRTEFLLIYRTEHATVHYFVGCPRRRNFRHTANTFVAYSDIGIVTC